MNYSYRALLPHADLTYREFCIIDFKQPCLAQRARCCVIGKFLFTMLLFYYIYMFTYFLSFFPIRKQTNEHQQGTLMHACVFCIRGGVRISSVKSACDK